MIIVRIRVRLLSEHDSLNVMMPYIYILNVNSEFINGKEYL